jgi:hypothetical protein
MPFLGNSHVHLTPFVVIKGFLGTGVVAGAAKQEVSAAQQPAPATLIEFSADQLQFE